jgi:hypothetical protein
MSVWSSATGTVGVECFDHFSLKKYTLSLYDEVSINIEYGEHANDGIRTDKFTLSVCLSGQQAMDFFTKWMEGILGKVDMTVELRMIK